MSLKRVDPNGDYTDIAPSISGVTVVGVQPVLADGSDATYLEAVPNAGGPTYGLSLLAGYDPGDPITLHVRVGIELAGPTDPDDDWRIEMYLATDAAGVTEFAGFSDGATSGFGFHINTAATSGIVEQVVPLSLGAWSPTTVADVVAALEAGAYLFLNSFRWVDGASEPLLRLYEAWIEVGVRSTRPPPLRRFPVDNGAHGPRRLYPPPKSRRAGGGYR